MIFIKKKTINIYNTYTIVSSLTEKMVEIIFNFIHHLPEIRLDNTQNIYLFKTLDAQHNNYISFLRKEDKLKK